jgi:peptide/nickel transport system substrate-binding protein
LERPLFKDVRVRRALTYAIDRPTMLEKVQHGLGELSDTFLDKTLYPNASDPTVMKYPFDPAKADALLDQAGWTRGSDGIRVKNGQRLSFELSTQVESTAGRLTQAQIQAYWHAIGAEVIIKNFPTSLFFDQTMNGIIAGGKYDVGEYAWAGAAERDLFGPLYAAARSELPALE